MESKVGYIEQALECLCGLARSGYGQQCRNKFVCDDGDCVMSECCLQLLENVQTEHPISEVLLECVSSFHLRHGCSVRTLLAMISVWYRVHHHLERQKLSSEEIEETLTNLLVLAISVIDGFSVDVKTVFNVKLQCNVNDSHQPTCKHESDVNPEVLSGEEVSFPEHSSQSDAVIELAASALLGNTLKPDGSSTGKDSAPQELIDSKLPETVDGDMNFEDISWYFEDPSSLVPRSLPTTGSVLPTQPLRLPSVVKEAPVKYPSCTESQRDDEFDSCFDTDSPSPSPSKSPQGVHNINDINWLNSALHTVKAKCNKVNNVTVERRPQIYSRNLFLSNKVSHNEPMSDPQTQRDSQSQASSNASSFNSFQSCYQQCSEDLYYDALSFGQLSASRQSKRRSSLPASSIRAVVDGISRGDTVIARLLFEMVDYIKPFVDRILPKHLDMASCVRHIGPSSSASQVYQGLILQTCSESLSILAEKSNYRALLFQGDLSSSYTPTGYRNPVKCCPEYRAKDTLGESQVPTWCDQTAAAISKCNITCVIMKGSCDTTLRNNLLSRGVLVLENVAYAVIRYISTHCSVPVLHYAFDIREIYTCELNITVDDNHLYRKAKTVLINVKLSSTSITHPSAMSVVLCSPISSQASTLEERFKHALSRLQGIVETGRCINGLSISLLAEQLYKHKSLQTSNGYLSVGAEYLTQELLSLASSQDDSPDSHVDDPVSTVAAWRSALSAAVYFSSMSEFVQTGVTP